MHSLVCMRAVEKEWGRKIISYFLFLGLLEEDWYKQCESCWDSGKLTGTEISVVCPHKKSRNWREELTAFFSPSLLLSLFSFPLLLPLPVSVPLYFSLLCTPLSLKHPSKNPADVSTSYSAPTYAFTCLTEMEKNVWCLKVLQIHLYVEKTKKRALSDSLLGWLAISSCCWALMLLEAGCVPEGNLRLELVTQRLVLCTVISIDGVLK